MSVAAEELYSLLVPLAEDRLIVPRACVAEVVRFSKPKATQSVESWMIGTVGWNGRDLPVVSYEGTLGNDVPEPTGRTRIVVFYATCGQMRSGYFGLLTQGFPQLVRVNSDVLTLESTEGWPENAPVLCRVRMINEYPMIPDLEKLELMVSQELTQA